jgi:uncharacterized protein with ParB-like and HNH nuclease domain
MEKLINLIQQFDTGDIALPIMQRDYVWRPRKVEDLLGEIREIRGHNTSY